MAARRHPADFSRDIKHPEPTGIYQFRRDHTSSERFESPRPWRNGPPPTAPSGPTLAELTDEIERKNVFEGQTRAEIEARIEAFFAESFNEEVKTWTAEQVVTYLDECLESE